MATAELFLRVPEERIGALIGPKGVIKKRIEHLTGVELDIDSDTGEVNLSAGQDALATHRAASVVKAVARGFSPENALLLLKEENELVILKLREKIGKRQRAIHTKKARLIGEQGKVRRKMERETGCKVSVYGNTVALIGNAQQLSRAEEAIKRILEGAGIPAVYDYLERRPRKAKTFEL